MEQKKVPLMNYAICAAFVFLFRFIPGFAGITPMGMGILGTFIGAIYGWMTIGMFWPSLVAIAGLAITLGMQPVLTYGFGSLVFFGLVFIGPLIEVCQQTGTFSWIIDKVLTSKALQGKGFITVWILFMAAFALGFTNPIIMAMVYCSFVTQICKQVGIGKNESFPVYVYIGVALSSMLGQVLLPFLGTGLTLVMAYNAMFPDYPLNFVSYLVAMMIISVVLITVYTLLCKFVFRVDVSKMSAFVPEGEVKPMNRDQKLALGSFLIFVLVLIVSSLPLGVISTELARVGMVCVGFVLIAILDILPSINGGKLLDAEASMKTVPWGLVLMMVYIMCIATFMNTPDTGIPTAMAALLTPFTKLPPLVFIVVALLFACIMTNFANNMIIIILVMPFMFNFASLIGLAPTGMIVLLFVISQFAIATPAASPVSAVAMSQEMADASVMTKAALKIVPIMFVIGMAIGWPLINILF